MQASLCAMTVALEKIDGDDPLLASATAHLSSSVDGAKRYHQLLNSIFWKTAKPTLKKNMRRSLNFLAYDVYTALMEAAAFLNRYSEIHRADNAPPSWWNETVINRSCIRGWWDR